MAGTEPVSLSWKRLGYAILNVALAATALALALKPGGYILSGYRAFREDRAYREAVKPIWPSLVRQAALIIGEGPPDLVVFSDYRCPFCAELDEELGTLGSEYPNLSVGVLFLPLSRHPEATPAAWAAACAEEQGALPRVHRLLFETAEREAPDWSLIVGTAGVPDLSVFRACMESMRPVDRLNAHERLAETLHVVATPTIVYAGGMSIGVPGPAELEALVHELVESGSTSSSGP